jgi:hypothetical protein
MRRLLRNRSSVMSSKRGEEAAERAKSAAHRVEELEERSKRLRAGETVTPEDLAKAEAAADDERIANKRAEERAKQAHLAAADMHRDAATVLQDTGHSDQAEEHRQAALNDERAAEEEESKH